MDRFPPPHPIYPPVIHYGPAPIPLRKEPHIPLTPKTGMRREEIERRIAEAGVTAEERASWNAKYAKPSTGIPKTDLASGVQASLDKADTALQEHQSLSGYATEEWVGEQGFLTEHQDITGKVDKSALFDNPDTNPMVKSALLPSYVDDVLEYDSASVFPVTGETGKIYVAKDTNKTYRWTGTQYVQVGGDEQAQADWAQTNSSAPDFIKNKPTIPAAQVQANWNETDTSSKAFIQNKPTIPTVPTNVSSFTNDAGYLTQHQSLSAYRTATAQDAIDAVQDTAIAAKYTKPGTGIPASDLASGVIPTVPVTSVNGETGNILLYANTLIMSSDDSTLISTAIGNAEQNAETALSEASGKASSSSLAPAFSSSSTYAVGDYCTHEGLLYKCTTAIATAGAWDAANWSAVAVTDEMGGGGAPKNVWYVGSTTGAGGTISGSTTTGDFVLAAGNVVVVKMSYGVNATSATLNIDGTGAKSISTRSGTTTIPKYFWSNEQAIAFVYSGTHYIPCGMATATIYNSWGLTSLSSTVSNDETKAATPKAVNTRAPLASPEFTGTPKAPTASAGTNTTQIATTAFVQTAVGGKLASAERNLLAYASTTTLAPETAVYRSALNADGTFPTITDTAIPTAAAYYQFELELTVPSTVPSTITGPSGWTFLDGHGLPDPADLSGGETIYVSVRLDCTARTFLASVWRVA